MQRNVRHKTNHRHERGQATLALVGVVVLACLAAMALLSIGEAIVHRANARNAADGVALGTAIDPDNGEWLAQWYRSRGLTIEQANERTLAVSGPSRAVAWAGTVAGDPVSSPVLRAIVSRVEQLLDRSFASVRWGDQSVQLATEEAAHFALLANEFGLCEAVNADGTPGVRTFNWC